MAGLSHKTIADFRKDNGRAIRKMCARFVELCREMGLLANASVDKQDFVYLPEEDVYRCPAGERPKYDYTNVEDGLRLRR